MKIAVIGASGQLGSDLVEVFGRQDHEVIGLDHGMIRVEDQESVHDVLGRARPDVVLNCAAFHDLNRCESEPATAFAVNALGALHVARAAADLGAVNVYFSTDYVFDGRRQTPYRESDLPRPLNVYGTSKLAGEHFTLNYSQRSFVLRVSGLYGRVPCRAKGENFVTKMVRLAGENSEVRVVDDEVLTPTPTREIAERTAAIVDSGDFGVFHLTCEGSCSWYEFAREIFHALEIETPLRRASVADFPSGVRRPAWSVLQNDRLEAAGVRPMPHWRAALLGFLRRSFAPAEAARG